MLDQRAGTVLRVGVVLLFLVVARPLLIPIVMGAIIALLLGPASRWLARRFPRMERQAPGLLTVGTLVLVLLPLLFVGVQAAFAGRELLATQGLAQSLNERATGLLDQINHLTRPLGIRPLDGRAVVSEVGPRLAETTTKVVSAMAAAVPEYLVDVLLFAVALYYFLRDGERLLRWMRSRSPFTASDTDAMFSAVDDTLRGAIVGTLAVALVQGALTLVALLALEIPGAFLWAVVASLCSFLPLVGTTPVTLGAAVYLFATGDMVRGIIMLVAAVIIGTSDNVVRPWAQSSRDGMHPLLALLSIFGGLELFGLFGVFLGPVAAALAMWALDAQGGGGQSSITPRPTSPCSAPSASAPPPPG